MDVIGFRAPREKKNSKQKKNIKSILMEFKYVTGYYKSSNRQVVFLFTGEKD